MCFNFKDRRHLHRRAVEELLFQQMTKQKRELLHSSKERAWTRSEEVLVLISATYELWELRAGVWLSLTFLI